MSLSWPESPPASRRLSPVRNWGTRLCWKQMSKDVKTKVSDFHSCARNCALPKRKHYLKLSHTKMAFEFIEMDILGPLSKISNEICSSVSQLIATWRVPRILRHCGRCSCMFRQSLLISLPCHVGFPDLPSCRLWSEARRKLVKTLYTLLGVNHPAMSRSNSQTNSKAGHYNKTTTAYLCQYTVKHKRNWDTILPPLNLHHNTQVKVTRETNTFRSFPSAI